MYLRPVGTTYHLSSADILYSCSCPRRREVVMGAISQSTVQNQILARLSAADFALFAPHLEAVDLPVPKQLERGNQVIKHVYFPDSGFASVVANGQNDQSIEVGLIGREG